MEEKTKRVVIYSFGARKAVVASTCILSAGVSALLTFSGRIVWQAMPSLVVSISLLVRLLAIPFVVVDLCGDSPSVRARTLCLRNLGPSSLNSVSVSESQLVTFEADSFHFSTSFMSMRNAGSPFDWGPSGAKLDVLALMRINFD
jgi:hypothetical protein